MTKKQKLNKDLDFEIGSDLHELSVIADRLPKLIESKINQIRHDHEILVNTILEAKNKEIKN